MSEVAKDPMKYWKNMGCEMNASINKVENGQPTMKKRLPRKIRPIPEHYFLPRKSLPTAIGIYGSCIVAGVGAGMLLEVWIKKKVKEDGGVIWEFGK